MKIKSITESLSQCNAGQYSIEQASRRFDREIEAFCKDKEILDVKVEISSNGTANWAGGLHNTVLNAIIKYN